MTRIHRTFLSFFSALCISILFVSAAGATETATSLAHKLQDQVLSGAGVTMKFNMAGEGRIAVTADLKSHRIRMESPSMLIVSDGKTVWNLQKRTRQVTIDNVSGTNSPFSDPASLFRFADNYSAQISANKGSQYTLELTPNARLAQLLKSAGEMQKLTLTLNAKSTALKIVKASASSARGVSQVSGFSISPLKTIKVSDFVFTPASNMKIIDLRE